MLVGDGVLVISGSSLLVFDIGVFLGGFVSYSTTLCEVYFEMS